VQLGHNEISGHIPEWVGELESLAHLSLNNNLFSGEIPAALMLKIDVLHKRAKDQDIDLLLIGNSSLKYVNMEVRRVLASLVLYVTTTRTGVSLVLTDTSPRRTFLTRTCTHSFGHLAHTHSPQSCSVCMIASHDIFFAAQSWPSGAARQHQRALPYPGVAYTVIPAVVSVIGSGTRRSLQLK
jgi:hypothetical protein